MGAEEEDQEVQGDPLEGLEVLSVVLQEALVASVASAVAVALAVALAASVAVAAPVVEVALVVASAEVVVLAAEVAPVVEVLAEDNSLNKDKFYKGLVGLYLFLEIQPLLQKQIFFITLKINLLI